MRSCTLFAAFVLLAGQASAEWTGPESVTIHNETPASIYSGPRRQSFQQTFHANAGDEFSFDYSVEGRTTSAGNWQAAVDIIGPSDFRKYVREYYDAGQAWYFDHVYINTRSVPLTPYSVRLPLTGDYTILVNSYGGGNPTAGVVDGGYSVDFTVENFRLEAVPEPSTWIMATVALLGLIGTAKQFRHQFSEKPRKR